jgi:epoxyqueuosine reductase
MRKQLGKLSEWLANNSPHQGRPFVDSAPVLERGLAERAGLGWIGKNCMLIHPSAGSWFFLGELFTSLPLPVDDAWTAPHCGRCTDCLQACPTGAFTAEGVLDARRCISYLTIEHKGEIPVSMRPLIGNRIFGCDDCQTVCPWNKKFGRAPQAPAFTPDPRFINRELVKLFEWTEEQFLQETAGTPIRRLGYERWTRNLAVALGNAPASERIRQALRKKSGTTGALAQSHIDWALAVQSLPDLNLSVIRSSKLG